MDGDCILDLLQYEGPDWGGGLTSFDIAAATDLDISTVRRRLRRLSEAGLAYACAPQKDMRADGRDAKTFVWFQVQ